MTAPTENLTAALAAVQASLPHVTKGKKADTGKYSYTYADLSDIAQAIHPMLGANGLAWVTKPTLNADGAFVLAYSLRHVSGEVEAGEYPLPDPANTPPQAVGSAITYGRRYCLCAVTGVVADADDDGAAAQGTTAKKPDRPRRQPTPDLYKDDKKAERGSAAPQDDVWQTSDPVAVEEWKGVVAAAADKDSLAAAWSDLNALCSTGQVTTPDRIGLVDLWNARKLEVLGADGAAA